VLLFIPCNYVFTISLGEKEEARNNIKFFEKMMNQRHWESDEEEENKREIRPEDFLYTNKPILTMIRKKKKQTKGH